MCKPSRWEGVPFWDRKLIPGGCSEWRFVTDYDTMRDCEAVADIHRSYAEESGKYYYRDPVTDEIEFIGPEYKCLPMKGR
jgi:hypothetical protein